MNRYSPAADDGPSVEPIADEANWIEPLKEQLPLRIHPVARVILVAMGGMLIVLLGIAAWLTPSPDGFGTHRQLQIPLLGRGADDKLPACSFLVFTGKPCPSCGMTTSWANLMDARLVASAQANLAGTMLGLCALMAGPWMLISGMRGRWLIGVPHERVILIAGLALFVLTFGNWIFRLLTW